MDADNITNENETEDVPQQRFIIHDIISLHVSSWEGLGHLTRTHCLQGAIEKLNGVQQVAASKFTHGVRDCLGGPFPPPFQLLQKPVIATFVLSLRPSNNMAVRPESVEDWCISAVKLQLSSPSPQIKIKRWHPMRCQPCITGLSCCLGGDSSEKIQLIGTSDPSKG